MDFQTSSALVLKNALDIYAKLLQKMISYNIVQLRHIITAEDNTVNKQDYYCLSFTAIEYSICKQYSIEKISSIFIAWLKWVLKQNK